MTTSLPSFLLTFCLFFTIGCQNDSDPKQHKNNCPPTENILKNPLFSQENIASPPTDWHISQHAGKTAFVLFVADNAVSITKIADQPWFTLSQVIEPKRYKNKTLTFSADLRLNLSKSQTHSFKQGGGLQVSIYGVPTNPVSGEELIYSSILENEPRLGGTNWFNASVTFKVPEKASSLRIGFLHQADGEMGVRNPILSLAKKTGCDNK